MTPLARELALALAGTAVGWILGYIAAKLAPERRERAPTKTTHFSRCPNCNDTGIAFRGARTIPCLLCAKHK